MSSGLVGCGLVWAREGAEPVLEERIRKFRFANETVTEAEAIRLLIERGLEHDETKKGKR